MKRSRLASFACLALTLFSFSKPASATWSIVFVDHRTGEVGIASATCVAGIDLAGGLPVIYPGRGAVASQSAGVPSQMLKDIWKGLKRGHTPKAIVGTLKSQTGSNNRQFGGATFSGPAVTWTGNATKVGGKAWGGVTGRVGSTDYAIQGNVLAGTEVIDQAEQAFASASGDLGQKMMAFMEMARRMGGDGRCSCGEGDPDGCGSPVPGFGADDKSAHVGFMILSRLGDDPGKCKTSVGCAEGDYYMSLEYNGLAQNPDPVKIMGNQFKNWRDGLIGRPDHILSTVEAEKTVLLVGDATPSRVVIRLADVDGTPLTSGGHDVTVVSPTGRPPLSALSVVEDNGDGTYEFTMQAGGDAGHDELEIWVDDGIRPVRLHPSLEVELVQGAAMVVGSDEVRVDRQAPVALAYVGTADESGAPYLMVGRIVGGTPAFTQLTAVGAGGDFLPGTVGLLDADGRAQGSFAPPGGFWEAQLGERFEWSTLTIDPATGRIEASATAGFDVVAW